MSIPVFQDIMLPILEYLSDGKEHSLREAYRWLANSFDLSEDEIEELFPSGNDRIFHNRIRWAKYYLSEAGLLNITRRGYIQITDKGLEMIKSKPKSLDVKFMKELSANKSVDQGTPEKTKEDKKPDNGYADSNKTPEENLEFAYQEIRNKLAEELLKYVKNVSPFEFEKLVVELLVKMGYGGTLTDAGETTKKTKDDGIDGTIKEDKLGLDIIYIQAKRWDTNPVGKNEIHSFIGALAGQGAKKGIFITTSHFTNDAMQYVPKNETKIVLIDGKTLAQLMFDYNLGVTSHKVYEVKRIDTDYFEAD